MRPLRKEDLATVEPIAETVPVTAAHEVEPFAGIRRGTADYRRASIALFMAGFSSFSLIYCVQPLLPAFKADFGLTPASASLALSLTTGMLAFSIIISNVLAPRLERRHLMFASMALGALFNIAAALSSGWNGLLIARALEGLFLGGVPAIAMAYLAEEMHPGDLGRAMGLYVGGTAFGAMVGRVGMGLVTELASWRVALGILGVLCLASAIGFLWLLPRSRNFHTSRGTPLSRHVAIWRSHLAKPVLRRLYGIGFLLTSVFVAVFNYCTFRLSGEPFGLGQTALSMIFLTYLLGTISSSLGGVFADRLGRGWAILLGFATILIGLGLTLFDSLALIVAGIAMITTGFFIGHAATSGAVGAHAGHDKAHASSLYLLFYYIGASVVGSMAGWFWQHGGWSSVAALTGACAVAGLVMALTIPQRAVRA